MFTQNRVQAAPVRIARFHLTQSRGLVSAVLINAGNANCATRTGDRVALACCDAIGKQLRVPAERRHGAVEIGCLVQAFQFGFVREQKIDGAGMKRVEV